MNALLQLRWGKYLRSLRESFSFFKKSENAEIPETRSSDVAKNIKLKGYMQCTEEELQELGMKVDARGDFIIRASTEDLVEPEFFALELNKLRGVKTTAAGENSLGKSQENSETQTDSIAPSAIEERADELRKRTLAQASTSREANASANDSRQNASHEARRGSSSSPPGDSGGERPPTDQKQTASDGKMGRGNGLVVILALILLGVAIVALIQSGMWNQISGSLLVGTFGLVLIAIGLGRKPKAKITPHTEESDEEATKAAGALASASLRGVSRRESFFDRISWRGRGFPEFMLGILLLSTLAGYWLIVGLQALFGSVPVYIIPIALAAVAVMLMLKYLKGWSRLVIVLFLGAFAWLFFMQQPFGKPKERLVDIGEKERSVYVDKIMDLRKDSALRAEDFAAQVNKLLQDASENQAVALSYVRDSAKRVDSTLRAEATAKDETISTLQAANADLRTKQVLTYHPKVTVPIVIGLLILGAIVASLFFKRRWVPYAVLGIAVLGIIALIWWASRLDVPLRKANPVSVPKVTWYGDSIRLVKRIDSLADALKKAAVTQNVPAATTVADSSGRDSLIQRIQYLESELAKKKTVTPPKARTPKKSSLTPKAKKRGSVIRSSTPVGNVLKQTVLPAANPNVGNCLQSKKENGFNIQNMWKKKDPPGDVLKN